MSLARHISRGFTLVELVVSLGLFAIVVLLSSGAYLIMVHLNQQAQATTTGINSISFALESMTRAIRTGTSYSCSNSSNQISDCPDSSSGNNNSFWFTDASGVRTRYRYVSPGSTPGYIEIVTPLGAFPLTDPTVVNISSLQFNLTGSTRGDASQPNVLILITGTVSSGAAGQRQSFVVETMATMRGTDL